MEKLASDGVKHQVPHDNVLPIDKRPEIHVKTFKPVTVIHLTVDQLEVSNQILSAGKKFGFFQV